MSEYTYSIIVIDLVGDEEDEITLTTVEKTEEVPEMCPYWQYELPLQIIEIE